MLLDSLTPFMLTNNNLNYFFNDENKKIIKRTTKKSDLKSPNVFIPYQNDKLFWIFFYMKYGYVEYNLVGSNSFTKEMDIKLNLSKSIKENKSLFKEFKFKKIGDNENELMCEKEMSFKTFIMINIIHNISFIYIVENMYYKYVVEDANECYIIHNLNNNYGCEKIKSDQISIYEKCRFHIENYEKPILCMSKYKMEELNNIAQMLNVEMCDEDNKKLKKNELYDNIIRKFNIFYKIE